MESDNSPTEHTLEVNPAKSHKTLFVYFVLIILAITVVFLGFKITTDNVEFQGKHKALETQIETLKDNEKTLWDELHVASKAKTELRRELTLYEEEIGELEAPIIGESTTVGIFQGYYSTDERGTNYGEGDPVTCHVFITHPLDGVTPPELGQYYVDKIIKNRNGIQTLTRMGQLRITLPWDEIPEEDRIKIMASDYSRSNTYVSITLEKKPEYGRGVHDCFSPFKYISI